MGASETRTVGERRLSELDGFRAVAILGVLGFHYTLRFPGYYPFDPITVFRYGYLGVHLFFMISGFVIALTLSKSQSAMDFAVRRWSRLFPPMLICSLVTFAFLALVDNPFTEMRRASAADFLPSWTFTQPGIWEWLVPNVKYVDGVYWSLFYEVRFYFWAAALFFAFGGEGFARHFAIFAAFSGLGYVIAGWAAPVNGSLVFETLFISKYIGLFCAGVLFFELYQQRAKPWVFIGLALCLASAIMEEQRPLIALALCLFFVAFFMLVYRKSALAPFRWLPLVWIGLVSYSLYLLHQNIGVGIINQSSAGRWSVFIATVATVALSSFIYMAVERHSSAIARAILAGIDSYRIK